ncbi:MAG: SRPBCC domain-containing protein [Sneathiellales bacterium]|nr:SRPBCC domain-containing protein [Sneathiellales bacterium]
MSEVTITKTVFFDVPPEIVWGYLTESEKLEKWFHRSDRDLKEGEDYALVAEADDGAVIKQCWGKVLTMNPPRLLVYTFTVVPLRGFMTTVRWELENCAGGTKITLHHSGLKGTEEELGLIKALDAGWDEHLGRLRQKAS